jgi:hypothetical protein
MSSSCRASSRSAPTANDERVLQGVGVSEPDDVDWRPLQTRGFVVLRSFFDAAEVESMRRMYAQAQRSETLYYSAVANPREVRPLTARLASLLPPLRAVTDILTDSVYEDGYFFPTEYTQLSWHTDHKSYYAIQDHYHYLNFWMPVVKPRADRSGLGLVPMDRLAEVAPEVQAAVCRGGAASVAEGWLRYESEGRIRQLRCPSELIDSIAEAPDVLPGDLIVARTDVLHKTQDAETQRVAFTIRAYWSGQPLSRSVLLEGSPEKHQRMLAEPTAFRGLLACFWLTRKQSITLAECTECYLRVTRREKRALLVAAAASLLFSTVLLPYRLRSMRRQTGSLAGAVRELVRFDARYRRRSREMRQKA